MPSRAWIAAVAFGLVFSCSALGQEQPLEEPLEPSATQGPPAIEPEAATPTITPTVPTRAEHDSGSAEHRAEDAPENSHLIFGDGLAQWIMAATGFCALVISAWAVWLLYSTLKATRKMIGEAEKATAAAEETVADTRRIGNAQVRAYVCATACFLKSITVGEKVEVEIRFVNFGASPAHAVNVRGSIIFDDLPQKPDHSQALTSLPFNTAGLPQGVPGSTQFTRKKLFSAEESRQFVDGKGAFYIYVAISYIDVFGLRNVARTTFLYSHEGGDHRGKASVAPYGNSFEWGKEP